MGLKKFRVGILTDDVDQEEVLYKLISQLGYHAKVPATWDKRGIDSFINTEILDVVICYIRPKSLPTADTLFLQVRSKHPITKRIRITSFAKKDARGKLQFSAADKRNCEGQALSTASPADFKAALEKLFKPKKKPAIVH